MKRRMLALLLAVILVLSVAPVSFAASSEAKNAAKYLNELGLFSGTGTNPDGSPKFDLDLVPDRNSGITMLVALLGKSEEARSKTWKTPFTDVPAWAKAPVGYAYTNKLTAGASATTFGGKQPLTASQYVTFVLTALGYKNGADFVWSNPFSLSDKLGITNGKYPGKSAFTRGDVAYISASALAAKMKGTNKTLLQSLIEPGAVDDPFTDIPTPAPKPTSTPRPTQSPTPSSTPTPEPGSKDLYRVTYQRCQLVEGFRGETECNIMIEIENITNYNLYLGTPTYEFEDPSGNLIGVCDSFAFGSSDPDIIAPGEKGYFYANSASVEGEITPESDYVFVPKLKVEKAKNKIIRYPISDLSITEGKYGPCTIIGRVTNNTDEEDSLVWLSIVLFDSKGKPLAAYGHNVMGVKAGTTVSFSADSMVVPDDIKFEDIADYQVIAAKSQIQF